MAFSILEEILHEAANDGNLDKLKKSANSKDENQLTALHKATKNGHLDMVKLLVQMGAQMEEKDDKKWTPLQFAARKGKIDVVKYLIEKGASVEAKENLGQTPLHKIGNNIEIAKCLLTNGAQVDAKDKFGNTPLYLAKDSRMAKFLIQNGANVNTKNNGGATPLHYISGKGFLEVVKFLLENGANELEKNQNDAIALHYASYNGHLEIVKLLVQKGSPEQFDIRNNKENTPFHVATQKGNINIANYLYEKKREMLNKINSTNNKTNSLCIICFTPKNGIFALNPCGHSSLCEPCCYNVTQQKIPKCPTCRKPIQDFTKLQQEEPEYGEDENAGSIISPNNLVENDVEESEFFEEAFGISVEQQQVQPEEVLAATSENFASEEEIGVLPNKSSGSRPGSGSGPRNKKSRQY